LSELLKRSVTGVVYAIVLIGSILLHPLAYFVAYLIILLLSLYEYHKLVLREGAKPWMPGSLILGSVPFILVFFHFKLHWPIGTLALVPGFLLIILCIEVLRQKPHPFMNSSWIIMGMVYIGLPFVLTVPILYFPMGSGYSPDLLIFVFLILWSYDTGAYLVGRLIGKRPLNKNISPHKTIEGLLGGLIIGFIVVWVLSFWMDSLPIGQLFIIGAVIMAFGTFGDFMESAWKRSLGIKDSGKSLPGHGGWLDRLDSFLFAIPAVFLCLFLLNQ